MLKKIYNLFHRHYHKKYHGIYQNAKKLFAFDIFLMVLSILILGAGILFFFWQPSITGLIDLNISLGNERLQSGDQVNITITYVNRSKYKLENVNLATRLPDGFIVDRQKIPLTIFSDEHIFSQIKTIEAGAKGTLNLYGQFWAEPNTEGQIIADLSYEPKDKNRREQKISRYNFNLPNSIINSFATIPGAVFPNNIIDLQYHLQNKSQQKIDNVSIAHDWFEPIFKNNNVFTLSSDENKIINGQITTPNRAGKYVLKIWPIINIEGKQIKQTAIFLPLEVVAPNIISSAQILPSSQAFAEPSKTIDVKIAWLNKSDKKINNTAIRLNFNYPRAVDLIKTAKENSIKATTDSLIITKEARTALANGNPQAGGDFTLKIYLSSNFNLTNQENPSLEIIPTVESDIENMTGQKFNQQGDGAKIPMTTEVKLNAEVRYYTAEGDQIGRGPLPPQVEQTTKYWVYIRLANSNNILNNASFTAVLPFEIEWTGKQSITLGQEIKYDQANEKILWQNNTIPAYSQTGLYFEVAVTPNVNQTGQTIKLLENINFTATDNFVGKKFNLSAPAVTNVLNKNDRGSIAGARVIQK